MAHDPAAPRGGAQCQLARPGDDLTLAPPERHGRRSKPPCQLGRALLPFRKLYSSPNHPHNPTHTLLQLNMSTISQLVFPPLLEQQHGCSWRSSC